MKTMEQHFAEYADFRRRQKEALQGKPHQKIYRVTYKCAGDLYEVTVQAANKKDARTLARVPSIVNIQAV